MWDLNFFSTAKVNYLNVLDLFSEWVIMGPFANSVDPDQILQNALFALTGSTDFYLPNITSQGLPRKSVVR